MSKIARWSYKNTATVQPFIGEDQYTGDVLYGPEYTFACTWAAESKQMRNPLSLDGGEFISNYIIWSEDPRPKYRDLIKLNTETETDWQEIKTHMAWDMKMFNDVPDYRTVT